MSQGPTELENKIKKVVGESFSAPGHRVQLTEGAWEELVGMCTDFIKDLSRVASQQIGENRRVTLGSVQDALGKIGGAATDRLHKAGESTLNFESEPDPDRQREYRTKRAGLTLQIPRIERLIREQIGSRSLMQAAVCYVGGATEELIRMLVSHARASGGGRIATLEPARSAVFAGVSDNPQ